MKLNDLTLQELTDLVADRIKRQYYLTPRQIVLGANNKKDFIENVLQFVCVREGLDPELIKSPKRNGIYGEVRMITYYLCRKFCQGQITLKLLGDFTNRDHATVLHSLKTLENLMATEPHLKKKVEGISRDFKEYYDQELFDVTHPLPE